MATKTDNQKIEGQEGEVKEQENKLKKKVSLDDREEVPSDPINYNKDNTHNPDNKSGRVKKNQKDDNKDPTDIPKNGKYYMHDDRGGITKENTKKKVLKNDKEWKHDKFIDEKDISKDNNEICTKNVKDVCKEDESTEKIVKGRGKTRYGKKESLEMDEIIAVKLEKKKSKNQEKKNENNKKTELKNDKREGIINNDVLKNKRQETTMDIEDKKRSSNKIKLKSLKNPKQVRIRERTVKLKNNFKTNVKINRTENGNENDMPKKEVTMETSKNKKEETIGYVKKFEVGGHIITQPIKNSSRFVSDQSSHKNYINNRNTYASKSVRGGYNVRRGSRGGKGNFRYRGQINTTSDAEKSPVTVYVPPETIPYPHVIQYANVIPAAPILPPTGAVYFNIPSTQQLPKPEKRERKILLIAEPSKETNGEK
uniref:Btz domain-containing protein n=1 Tax=Strongyloides papillosus TaxID=174720 RepID=A0A0N5C8H6_STREA